MVGLGIADARSPVKDSPVEDGLEVPRPEETTAEFLLSGPRRTSDELSGFSLRPSQPICLGRRYEIEGCLGEGGTALVYLARDLERDRLVVVKVMKPEIAKTPELKARFLFEAHALARVDHPSVVKILDISDSDGQAHDAEEPPYLVLEALPGESLGEYLKRHETMPVGMAVSLLRESALALAAVHRAGLVHRDIKPDNIYLVGPLDSPTHVKVLDFGMAHVVDDGHDEESTSILGTAQYMAPEQILVEPVDARTDIYGLGVVLFRTVTGHLPFDDVKSKHHLLRHQLFSPVPPASWLHEGISRELERLIHRATRKAPAARYANMEELIAGFDAALDVIFGIQHAELEIQHAELGIQHAEQSAVSAPVELGGTAADFLQLSDPDIYVPSTRKGRHAAEVLAVEFGIYSKPQRVWPPQD